MILALGTGIISPGIWWLNWVKGDRHYLIYIDKVSVYFAEWEGKGWIRISLWSWVTLGRFCLSRLRRWSRLVSCWWWILWAWMRIIWERGWNISNCWAMRGRI